MIKEKSSNKVFAFLLALLLAIEMLSVSARAQSASDDAPASEIAALVFSPDSNGNTDFLLSPAFSSRTCNYTVTVPDYTDSLNFFAAPKNGSDKIVPYRLTDTGTMEGYWSAGTWNDLYGIKSGTAGLNFDFHVGQDPSYTSTADTSYKITVNRNVTLKSLTVDGASLYPAFDPAKQSYSVGVDESATTAAVMATAYGKGYSLKINGSDAASGTASNINLIWDKNGQMTIPIEVSCDGAVSTAYTLTLVKKTKDKVPVIYNNPIGASYLDTEKAPAPFTIAACADGTLSYQWYENTQNSNTDGTKIDGATESSYTPSISNVGTTAKTVYYYCEVTNTQTDGTTASATSEAAAVKISPDPTPTVSLIDSATGKAANDSYDCNVGDQPVTLSAEASSRVSGGIFNYTWNDSNSDWDLPTTQSYTPAASQDGSIDYYCTTKYFVDGHLYTADSGKVTIKVTASSAQSPAIKNQPVGQDYLVDSGTAISSLCVSAVSPDSGTLSYQWYKNTENSNTTGTAIDGATDKSYTPQSFSSANTTYYYCEITNTVKSSNGTTYTNKADTEPAAVVFGTAADLGGKWAGSGTAASPYLIASQSDLVALRDIVNKGISFKGCNFKLTADITLPDSWVPIGSLMTGQLGECDGEYMWPFSGTLDGGGKTVTVPSDGLPMFGYVRFATVKNLGIYGTNIAGYGLVNNYCVDYGPTGNYDDWTATASYPDMPTTIVIDNVTLKKGSSTKMSGFIGGYASGADTVYIRNSTVESGVTIGNDKSQSDIGSFAGDFNGYIENCRSDADVYGKDNVGGFIGMKGQSMGNCTAQDCAFGGTVTATGSFAGGIVGGGYNGGNFGISSAPNTPCVSIENCYVTGSVTGADDVGGLFGGEPGCKQCWANGIGYIDNNCVTGKVAATAESAQNVGGDIGYMKSLDRYNIISNNFYLDTCGAASGIGGVGDVDKNTTTEYCRSDDPTGADADKLTKSTTAAQLSDGTVTKALNAGVNSNGDWIQNGAVPGMGTSAHFDSLMIEFLLSYNQNILGGDSLNTGAMRAYAVYSDGTNKPVDMSKVVFTGFNSDLRGYDTVTATYENHAFVFEVDVCSNADYKGDIADAKKAISGASYAFMMGDANTSDAVKTLIGNKIGALDLKGVTATVVMNSFTPAAAKTLANPVGKVGSFTFTVNLSKGKGAASVSDSVLISGSVSAAATEIAGAYTSDLTADGATVWFSTGFAGTYYYKVLPRAQAAPTAASIISSAAGKASAGDNSFALTGLQSSTDYEIYLIAADTLGNITDTYAVPFSTVKINDTSITAVKSGDGLTSKAVISPDFGNTSKYRNISVDLGDASVTLSAANIKNIFGCSTSGVLSLSKCNTPPAVKDAADKALSGKNMTDVASLDIDLSENLPNGMTETIHDIGGTSAVTLKLSDAQAALIANAPKAHLMYYDKDTGSLTDMNAAFNLPQKTITFTTTHFSTYIISTENAVYNAGVSYAAHVQHIGWQDFVADGADAGTTGRRLRMEALKLKLTGNLPSSASITYQAHVQKIGWQSAVSNGDVAGTTGKSLRVEAVKITLGGLAGYEVRYRAHVQNIGWMPWQVTKNGTAIADAVAAGTMGRALRMEALEVEIVKAQ